jgi:NAD+ diphosphatase
VSRRFVGALVQPDEPTETIVSFGVRAGELLVVEDSHSPIPTGQLVELGLEVETRHYLGRLDGIDCFAVEVPDDAPAPNGMTFSALRPLWSVMTEDEFALAGRAVQIVEWYRTHRFCGRCGTPTEPAEGERAMRCRACDLLAFPRVSPAMIVRITRGEEILLAHGARFPGVMYSVLAGFVEPGESLEECVHREVREEVGIEVANVRYFGSQPWPFPHSLMVGFTAEYAGGELQPDPEEIKDVGWFRADELPPVPPGISIARKLIDDWLARRDSGDGQTSRST